MLAKVGWHHAATPLDVAISLSYRDGNPGHILGRDMGCLKPINLPVVFLGCLLLKLKYLGVTRSLVNNVVSVSHSPRELRPQWHTHQQAFTRGAFGLSHIL